MPKVCIIIIPFFLFVMKYDFKNINKTLMRPQWSLLGDIWQILHFL